jgi:hypothetical protein
MGHVALRVDVRGIHAGLDHEFGDLVDEPTHLLPAGDGAAGALVRIPAFLLLQRLPLPRRPELAHRVGEHKGLD